MATAPLVGLPAGFGPMVHLSLAAHGVPVDAVFDLYEEDSGLSFLGVATPLLDQHGARVAYRRMFEALAEETFAPQSFLRLNMLVLSHEDLVAIRKSLKRGTREITLPKLAHLGQVTVRTTPQPQDIQRSGLVHVTRHPAGRDYEVTFSPIDGPSELKSPQRVPRDKVMALLTALKLDADPALNALPLSVLVTAPLSTLYEQGLI